MKTLEKLASNKNELLFIEEFYMLSEYQKVVYIFQEKVLPWLNQTVEQFCCLERRNSHYEIFHKKIEVMSPVQSYSNIFGS